MAAQTLEARVAELEAEVKQFKQQRERDKSDKPRGWRRIVGVFKDDPEFEEAVRARREWRESFRPKDDEDAS